MLSERLNGSLPVSPNDTQSFKERLVAPALHISKSIASLVSRSFEKPMATSAVVLSLAAALTADPYALLAAVAVNVVLHLDSRTHTLCLRSPDSSARSM